MLDPNKLIDIRITNPINPFIDEFGNKWWYNDQGHLHRKDGPACEYANGDKDWYINGTIHREDGPAQEYGDGIKFWWYNGRHIDCGTQEEFERIIKLELFW